MAATRWPDQELVKDHSQGLKLAVMQELARCWAADYDWRRCEAKLNGLPVIELLAVIDPLTNPTAHGGSAADAFDVVIPSMLYGFCPDTGHN